MLAIADVKAGDAWIALEQLMRAARLASAHGRVAADRRKNLAILITGGKSREKRLRGCGAARRSWRWREGLKRFRVHAGDASGRGSAGSLVTSGNVCGCHGALALRVPLPDTTQAMEDPQEIVCAGAVTDVDLPLR